MRRLLLLFGLLVLLRPALTEAQVIPVKNKTIDYVSKFDDYADQMVDQHMDALLAEGQNWLTSLTIVLAVWMLLLALFSRSVAAETFVEFSFRYLIAYGMLQFYDSPMPWGSGESFHQIFAANARWITGLIDLSILNNLMDATLRMWNNLEQPGPWNIPGWFVYLFTVLDLAGLWFVSFAISSASYIAMALGSLLGPIFIPWFVSDALSWLFWGWFRYMVTYSLWGVCSAGVLYVYANVMMWFVSVVIGNDYSLGNLQSVFCIFPALVVSGFVMLFFSYKFASDLVSGHASASSPIAGVARIVAAKVFA